ncbi:hypothetical protein [Piscirickettsia litoralis]|uniref:Uncharacterized protein n=1 Tax=Piscirickettsia litoralis TaxID=1891921 RepID=A0ABX3A1C4_9GAMM|nr:hypothetical protein [Piscirickettsia litoralis]ODN41466.1 hypothetical protein BGC07_15200 [Piscirickettsia litoralis]
MHKALEELQELDLNDPDQRKNCAEHLNEIIKEAKNLAAIGRKEVKIAPGFFPLIVSLVKALRDSSREDETDHLLDAISDEVSDLEKKS